MSLTQELPTEIRERLEEEAARRGQEPDALLLSLVAASLPHRPPARRDPSVTGHTSVQRVEVDLQALSAADEAERFRQWADGQPRRGVPVIPLEALDREHIYGDHA